MPSSEVPNEVRHLGERVQRSEPFIRCYVPRVERSGTRMQCGQATEGSEEVASQPVK